MDVVLDVVSRATVSAVLATALVVYGGGVMVLSVDATSEGAAARVVEVVLVLVVVLEGEVNVVSDDAAAAGSLVK